MKNKLYLNLLLCLFLAPTVFAQDFANETFLNGYNLIVTNNSTNTYSGTNIYALGYTVTNGSPSPIMVTNTSAFADADLWANRDGTALSANISVTMHGNLSTFTNIARFNFVTVPAAPRSPNYPGGLFVASTATNPAGSFTFDVPGNGTNYVTLSTNLPTTFLQGCAKLRLASIAFTNTGGSYGSIDGVFLNGYKQGNSQQARSFLGGYNVLIGANSTNQYGASFAYSSGFTGTNTPITVTNTGAFTDVSLWGNQDGSAPVCNISVQMAGLSATFTNLMQFNIERIPAQPRSPNYPAGLFGPATQTQDTFAFYVPTLGTNVVCVTTNLPSSFLQGAVGLRLNQVIPLPNPSGAYGYIQGVFLNGNVPSM